MIWLLWVAVGYMIVGFVHACFVFASTNPKDLQDLMTELSGLGAVVATWLIIDVLWYFLEYKPAHHRSTQPS